MWILFGIVVIAVVLALIRKRYTKKPLFYPTRHEPLRDVTDNVVIIPNTFNVSDNFVTPQYQLRKRQRLDDDKKAQ